MAALVIMQPDFQQSVLLFSEGASDSVPDIPVVCVRVRIGSAKLWRKWPRSSSILSVGRPVMPGIMVGMLISRRRDSTDAVLGLVVIAPVVMQRQVPCDIFQQSLATV